MDWDKENPLNRIPGESRAANAALRDYYLMGTGRSLRKLLERYTQQSSNNPPTKTPTVKFNTLSTWSHKYHWQDRVIAQREIDDAIALAQYRERHMSADEALAHIADIAKDDKGVGFFFLYDEKGYANGLDWAKVKEYGHLIKTLTFTNNGPKIELYSRLDALEKVGRHHGLFTDKIDIKLEKELEVTLDALEKSLEPELYERILGILSVAGDSESSPE